MDHWDLNPGPSTPRARTLTSKPSECRSCQPLTATYRTFTSCQPLVKVLKWVSSLNPHHNLRRRTPLLSPFYRWGNWGRLTSVNLKGHSLTLWLPSLVCSCWGNANQPILWLWSLWAGYCCWEKRADIWSLDITETVIEFYRLYSFNPTKDSGSEWRMQEDLSGGEWWWAHFRARGSKCY